MPSTCPRSRTRSTTPQLHPAERDTAYLLNPDPNDSYFRKYPGKFRAELHNRLSSPLYGLLFAVLPLVFLGQAESPRQSRAASVTMAVFITAALRALGVFLPNIAETSTLAVWLLYAVPLGGVLAASVLILTGRQLQPPEAIVGFAEAVFARTSGMLRRQHRGTGRRRPLEPMFGRTLSFYFARHFAKMVLSIFMLGFLLITAVTYIEFFNRAFKGDYVGGFTLALVALFRVPSVTEDALPFAVLYGSIAAFVIANRRLEVVVARAAGVSAMQFLLPACLVGLIIGVVGTTVYNPLAVRPAQLVERTHHAGAAAGPRADRKSARAGLGAPGHRQRSNRSSVPPSPSTTASASSG